MVSGVATGVGSADSTRLRRGADARIDALVAVARLVRRAILRVPIKILLYSKSFFEIIWGSFPNLEVISGNYHILGAALLSPPRDS